MEIASGYFAKPNSNGDSGQTCLVPLDSEKNGDIMLLILNLAFGSFVQ